MSVEDFKEKLKENSKLLSDIEFLQKHINDEPVLKELFDLCRMTYITQFEADIFKNEDGKFESYISNVHFKSWVITSKIISSN